MEILSDDDFFIFSDYIQKNLGIQMPISKKLLLQSRLQSRLKAREISNFKQYIEFLFNTKEGLEQEIIHFTDVVTTNKTSFFRENEHFDHLLNVVIPYVLETKNHINVWSAACSSGEEPYTICMVMEMAKQKYNRKFTYSILATDLSSRILEKAQKGIYTFNMVSEMESHIKKQFFNRSKDPSKDLVRVKSELRQNVRFKRLNFMDNDFGLNETFDVIFCRNVIIYFDKKVQAEVIMKLCNHLSESATLFLGHSETVMNMNLPLKEFKGPGTTYQKL